MKVYDPDSLRVFFGPTGEHLKEGVLKKISSLYGQPIEEGKYTLTTFKNQEIEIGINESIRGKTTFLVMPMHVPHKNIFIALSFIRTLSEKAKKVYVVCPSIAYTRSDKKDKSGITSNFKLLADLIYKAGADGIIVMDLHAESEMYFFSSKMEVERLFASFILIPAVKEMMQDEEFHVFSPDIGGMKRSKKYKQALGCDKDWAFDKARIGPNQLGDIKFLGDAEDKLSLRNLVALIVDDMIDTAGSICEVAKKLHELGVKTVEILAIHPEFSDPCFEKINDSPISKITVTDSRYHSPKRLALCKKEIKVISIAEFIGQAIYNNHNKISMSDLFIDIKE
ncbi:MAG: Ribose-phosphate pyrophosphokinase [candidate division CPR2 bacterium GW2011_GWC1_39_9]|uniref:Ribose-phosphate pyrophosphokinase n=1 Tax=candidate division CPR2 bacterium GW2011_GWC2_39_10 TaxID=1618345 RepID=A0A0G0PVZ0_UNCC2|nr:MAG: Ribose-phosphate pyrophosphokinase [candidate division CPR2 bacterium GW2011_GWC2_39_10]KKR33324.1 MAG: Ribose-phosphate pyrophosphokinase [candidate division CPR2 bacterium GW2011_GWC1_39_9]